MPRRSGSSAKPGAIPYGHLRTVLSQLPETGDDGFEGLVASACAQILGVPVRLIGAGRQFGRDAEAWIGQEAVLFEAKRYSTRLSYAALSTKLQEALDRSGRPVEVWGAVSTVPFEGANAADLKAMGESRGVTVLILDWTAPVPPLAVLLALADEATGDWFHRNQPDSVTSVASELAAVRRHALYPSHAGTLKGELTARSAGLAHARRRNLDWLRSRFSDRQLALHSFNQPLAPLDSTMRPRRMARHVLEAELRAALETCSPWPGLVTVTGPVVPAASGLDGDEGVGKSWAVANAWLTQRDTPENQRPLLLFMTPHMWSDGDEQRPMTLLARLLAMQTGSSIQREGGLERYEAKLERWLARDPDASDPKPTLVLVLDGVNERLDRPWAALVAGLIDLARERAIRIVLTTRRGTHQRDLAPRLQGIHVTEISVSAFSDAELAAVLSASGRTPEAVTGRLRAFLRNPRMLSVGLELLDRLDPQEVSVERLLFEYLRKRQEERSRRGGHTAAQLAQTLVRHAREVRDRVSRQQRMPRAAEFDEDGLAERLGVPLRHARLAADLDDIVESQFLRIVDPDRMRYAFTTQALPLGLGLLLVDELVQAARDPSIDLEAHFETLVDPIRAIDETVDVVLSALSVSMASAMDPRVQELLLQQVLTFQNVPVDCRRQIFAGLPDYPQAYIAVAERLYGEPTRPGRRDWMRDAFGRARFRSDLRPVLDEAVRRWLRMWQPRPPEIDVSGYGAEQAESTRRYHAEASGRHREALAQLTPWERTFVAEELHELAPGYERNVDELAITLLAGRPLLPFAEDLFAWCVATAAGWQGDGTLRTMNWLRRLAPADWRQTTDAIGCCAAQFPVPSSSNTFRWAVRYALLGSGDPDQASRAEGFRTLLGLGSGSRRSAWPSGLPDMDPCDPSADEPVEGMDALVDQYRAWASPQGGEPPTLLLRGRSSITTRGRLILARFRPDAVAAVHRDLADRLPTISGVAPTVLAGFVALDAAILGPVATSLIAWRDHLLDRGPMPIQQVDAPTHLLAAVLPHLTADERLRTHSRQAPAADDGVWLAAMLAPVADTTLRCHLEAARASGDPHCLRAGLIFATATRASIDTVRGYALEALASASPRQRAVAARMMTYLGAPEDDAAFLQSGWRWDRSDDDPTHIRENFWKSRWLARIRAGQDDPDLLDAVNPAIRSAIVAHGAAHIAGAAASDLLEALERGVPSDFAVEGMEVQVVREDDGPDCEPFVGSWHALTYTFGDDPFEVSGTRPRAPRDLRDFLALERRLVASRLESLLYPLSSAALDRIAHAAPDSFERLLGCVEQEARPIAAVLAHDIARRLSTTDPARAADLFLRYEHVAAAVPEIMPVSRVPRPAVLLWRASDAPNLEAVRDRRLDMAECDLAIAQFVLAAEIAGRHARLVAYVRKRMTSDHPAALARAVTAAGFAVEDPYFDAVFDDPRLQVGFLCDVKAAAKRAYDEARWARHWFDAARASPERIDIWRFTQLAAACADTRSVLWLEERGGSDFEMLRPLAQAMLNDAARDRDRERSKTLFGVARPPTGLLPPAPVF